MNSLKVLDVTLRDGGCVNNFNFGQSYMEKILSAQEDAGIDIIELGYIDEIKGSASGRTQYINEKVISDCILKRKKPGVTYVAMVDYGKFDFDKLDPKTENGIDGIRLAFHKKNCFDIVSVGRDLIKKGYQLFIQPMITLRYSDSELIELIDLVNEKLYDASGFYIVDSFGEMRPNDMSRMLNLVDHNLIPDMTLGFHSHNNLQLSYSNTMEMLQFPTKRDMIIDCSIMGMGKGAGNLNTELLLEHLNLYYKKEYDIAPLLQVIDKIINPLHDEYNWGYAPEFYLSSTNHCTPSYASYFYNEHMLPIDQVSRLLGSIAEDKKISFDQKYAEELYHRFNETIEVDDSEVINELSLAFADKKLILIAPGKSVGKNIDKIKTISSSDNILSIGLNVNLDFDYILATRIDVCQKALDEGKKVIVPSNVSKGIKGNAMILDYAKWIDSDERTYDSAAVFALKLAQKCSVKEIMLAGMDGFSSNVNDNYFDYKLRRSVSLEKAERRNKYYKEFIKKIAESGIKIEFLTPSKYYDESCSNQFMVD